METKNIDNKLKCISNEWQTFCESYIPQIKARHFKFLKKECNLENPELFTDKLEWLKVYDSTPLKTLCSDKILVKKYVYKKLGTDICIPIIKSYNTFDEINFNELPKNYVLKTNHGSHNNIVVKDNQIDIIDAKTKINEWISKDWSWWSYELHYININRKIFAEKYIDNLTDYKFYCFNGKIGFAQIDRHEAEGRINYYTKDWEPLSWISNNLYPNDLSIKDKKPITYSKMIEYAEILAKDFTFVRVDFYEADGILYFGELTFIPGAAYINYSDPSADKRIGSMLKII